MKSCRVIEGFTQEEFSLFVVAVIAGNPGEGEHALLQSFLERDAANSVGVGSGQRSYLIFLQISMLIIKRLSSSWVGGSGDIIVVFKLPIGPAPEVKLHEISEYSYFLCAFETIGESSELSQEAACLESVYILFFGSDLQGIEDFAELCGFWFPEWGHIRTINVVTKYLGFKLALSSRSIDKATREDIKYAWLEENRCLLIDFPDRLQDSLVGWQQVLVVALSWQQSVRKVLVSVIAYRLVDKLVAYQIGFVRQISCDYFPKFAQVIEQSSLICEQILLQLHHVIRQVERSKFNRKAIFTQGETLFIKTHLDSERGWERLSFGDPYWQSFSTELPHKKILMSIQEHADAVSVAFPEDFPEGFDISVVINTFLRFNSFPGSMQPNDVHSPMLKVHQILIGEAIVG